MKSGLEKKMFEKDAESAAGALPKNILNGFQENQLGTLSDS